jgi:hypothetical protein
MPNDNEMVSGGVPSVLIMPQATMQQWAERRAQFNVWVSGQLKKGVDYGRIEGTTKDCLYKPGAEKIFQFYGLAVTSAVTERRLDLETGHLYVEVTSTAVSNITGQVVGTGLGACSTYEAKYRYRKEWFNGKGEPGAGWSRTRNGKYYREVENADLADVWNTIVKMGEKRSRVDLALSVSGASELFTQDVEDLRRGGYEEEPEQPTQSKPAAAASAPATAGDAPKLGAVTWSAPATSAHSADTAHSATHWFNDQRERGLFFQWANTAKLALPVMMKLAAANMGSNIPLTSPLAWPGDRESLQTAILAQVAKSEQAATAAKEEA